MSETTDLLHRLKAMESDWQATPKTSGYGDELDGIEDGEGYQGRVESFEMFPGRKNPNAVYLKTTCSFQNHSEYGGREITRLDEITSKDKLVYLKEFLHKMGVDVDSIPLTELVDPAGPTLNGLLDKFFVFDVYTNKKGYRNWALRQVLDSSDLGTTQEQIAGFEQNTDPKTASVSQQAGATEKAFQKAQNKPDDCICKDPSGGDFDENCPIAGHGIEF